MCQLPRLGAETGEMSWHLLQVVGGDLAPGGERLQDPGIYRHPPVLLLHNIVLSQAQSGKSTAEPQTGAETGQQTGEGVGTVAGRETGSISNSNKTKVFSAILLNFDFDF